MVYRHVAAVATLGLALAGCQSGALTPQVQRGLWTFRSSQGTTLTTPKYQIFTTCRDSALLDALPRILEGAAKAYAQLVPANPPLDRRMQTYLFANRAQWEAFTRDFAGARAPTYLMIRSGGYEEDGVAVAYYTRRADTLSVVTHEGFHQYLSATQRRHVPAWLNEGLACYFESFEMDGDGWPVFKPRDNRLRLPHLRDAVQAGRLYPLPELLSIDAGHAVSSGEERTRTYYAQLWALTLFLLEPDRVNPDAAGFRRMLAELGTEQMRLRGQGVQLAAAAADRVPPPEEAVFRYYITHDLDGFSRRFEAYARKLAGL